MCSKSKRFGISKDMKKILLIASILATSVYAKDSISIGTLADGTEFKVEKHFYGKYINGFTPVQGKPQLCIRIGDRKASEQQELGLYDISEHRMKWTTDVDYSKDYYIATRLGVLLYSDKKTYFLNEEGDICWEKKGFLPFYADVRDSVVVGYPSTKSKQLHGVSMKKGKNLWVAEIPQKGGWREMRSFDNGHMLISSDKIFKLNAWTGEMSSFDVDNMHKNDKGAWTAALGSAIGIGLALATGTGFITTYSPNGDSNFYQLNSNFCIDDDRIYYADRSSLYCLDYNLHPIWVQELPKKASFSYLYIQNDTLFYENSGYGKNIRGNYYCDTKPYQMHYDLKDGTELSEKKNLKDEDYHVNCYMKEADKSCFSPRKLTYKEMEKLKRKKRNDVYETYRKLSKTHSLISCDKDFYIIDLDGNILLHFSEPIIQAELVDDVLVGLTDLNVIFQFNLSALKI